MICLAIARPSPAPSVLRPCVTFLKPLFVVENGLGAMDAPEADERNPLAGISRSLHQMEKSWNKGSSIFAETVVE